MLVIRPAYRITSLGFALLFGLGTGCSDRTGILLEVTRDEATTPVGIDQIRFFVGTQIDPEAALAGNFVDDGDPAEQVDLADGRDLADDPYRLLLNRGDTDAGELMLAVAAYQDGQLVGFGGLDQTIQFIDGRVLQWEIMVKGGWTGRVDVTATGCLTWTTDVGTVVIASADDHDCDGDPSSDDCNDEDATVGPSQPEICANEINDDCDLETDEEEDADGDGVSNCTDCDDADRFRFPGNPEVCDGIDNDCNLRCDDGALDYDQDDYTICDRKILPDGTCSDVNVAHNDCNDGAPEVHPGAAEICDGVDNNCNEQCDEGSDPDHDSFTECGSRIDLCNGIQAKDIDCEPENEDAFPGNTPEWCDGVDNDCNGQFYPATVGCYVLGGEDHCLIGARTCGDAEGEGWTSDCVAPVEAGEIVPGELCAAYAECTDAADPYGCANDLAAVTTYACTLRYHVTNPDQLCAPASAMLPNATTGGATCFWAVMPGAAHPPAYDVGFAEAYNAAALTQVIDICQPFLVINQTLVVPPIRDRFVLFQTASNIADAAAQIFLVDITPVPVSECVGNGLVCPELPPFD